MRIIKASDSIMKYKIKQLDSNTTFYPRVEEIDTSKDFSPSKFPPSARLHFPKNLITYKNSSNINQVIRPVLNSFFFFCDKISQVQKSIFLINITLKSIYICIRLPKGDNKKIHFYLGFNTFINLVKPTFSS